MEITHNSMEIDNETLTTESAINNGSLMKAKNVLPENQDNENENGPHLKLGVTSNHMTYSSTAKSLNGYGIRHDPYYSTYIGMINREFLCREN